MSNTIDQLIIQVRRDIVAAKSKALRAKAKRVAELKKRHQMFGLDVRARLVDLRRASV